VSTSLAEFYNKLRRSAQLRFCVLEASLGLIERSTCSRSLFRSNRTVIANQLVIRRGTDYHSQALDELKQHIRYVRYFMYVDFRGVLVPN